MKNSNLKVIKSAQATGKPVQKISFIHKGGSITLAGKLWTWADAPAQLHPYKITGFIIKK
jgi:hypothetical protein